MTHAIDLARGTHVPTGAEPLSITALICQATAVTLLQHPRLNAHLVDDEIREYRAVHLGIAVALDDGLLVPVLKDAHLKSVQVLQVELRDLAYRARGNGLPPEAIRGSTFTISNLGMYGVEQFTAIVNPPEVGILSLGKICELPVVSDGGVVIRQVMQSTLCVDHRALDGAVGARFLQTLKSTLESPQSTLK